MKKRRKRCRSKWWLWVFAGRPFWAAVMSFPEWGFWGGGAVGYGPSQTALWDFTLRVCPYASVCVFSVFYSFLFTPFSFCTKLQLVKCDDEPPAASFRSPPPPLGLTPVPLPPPLNKRLTISFSWFHDWHFVRKGEGERAGLVCGGSFPRASEVHSSSSPPRSRWASGGARDGDFFIH